MEDPTIVFTLQLQAKPQPVMAIITGRLVVPLVRKGPYDLTYCEIVCDDKNQRLVCTTVHCDQQRLGPLYIGVWEVTPAFRACFKPPKEYKDRCCAVQ